MGSGRNDESCAFFNSAVTSCTLTVKSINSRIIFLNFITSSWFKSLCSSCFHKRVKLYSGKRKFE